MYRLGVSSLASVVLCLAPWPRPAHAGSIEVPTSSIRSAQDIKELLGAPPPEASAPKGFSWTGYGGSIDISTSILFPLNGSVRSYFYRWPFLGISLETLVSSHPMVPGGAEPDRGDADDRRRAAWSVPRAFPPGLPLR